MRNFLISSASENINQADWLKEKLDLSGFTHWFTPQFDALASTERWLSQLEAASDLVILLSPDNLDVRQISSQLMAGIRARTNIVVVKVSDFEISPEWQFLLQSSGATVIEYQDHAALDEWMGEAPKTLSIQDQEVTVETVVPEEIYREVTLPHTAAAETKATSSAKPAEPVQFTTYHPARIAPGQWQPLLVYAHLAAAIELIQADSRNVLGADAHNYNKSRGVTAQSFLPEAEITIVPEMPGFRFNPPRQVMLWLEDWHRADFRMQANPAGPHFNPGSTAVGRVRFFVGPVLIGETNLATYVVDSDAPIETPPKVQASAQPYRNIFISYAHRDTALVEEIEKHIATLGDRMLRDVYDLRSGEDWNARLLELIEMADIFQLFWSHSAKDSPYVEQEWRHALAQNRKYFIRPVYWEDPMPRPPDELAHLQFDSLKL